MKMFIQGFVDGVIFFSGASLVQFSNTPVYFNIIGYLMIIYGIIAYFFHASIYDFNEEVKE